jgi:nucleoside-diphosphate-sugar epimerase
MSRYAITGATGFVGGAVAARLRAAGHEVTALARDVRRAASLAAMGCRVVPGDLGDVDSLRTLMRDTDGIFHVAGWYKLGARDPMQGERINVEGTRHVLEVMRELGIAKGVYTSTLAVHGCTHGRLVDETFRFDGPFESVYDRTKWEAHTQVAVPMIERGLPLVIVQPGLVYGPGDEGPSGRILRTYLQRKLPLVPEGAAYCWAHVDDVAAGHVLAMERGRPGESYHLAGPPATVVSALALAERITGIPGPRFRAPPILLRVLAAVMTPVAALVPVPEDYQPETLRVLAGCTYLGTNDKARRELGWEPRDLESGLGDTLRHEMNQLGIVT